MSNSKRASSVARPLSKSEEIAMYFGFVPIENPSICRKDNQIAKQLKERPARDERICFCNPAEKAALLRTYEESDLNQWPHPVQVYYKKEADRRIGSLVGLDIFGANTSASNALLIRSAVSMLEEKGLDDLFVEVNSIGDKNSFTEFERQVVTFIRKNANDIPASIHRLLRHNPFHILNAEDPKIKDFAENAPKAINFLSENSRVYLKEVIEYLEGFGMPYIIKHSLTANPTVCSGVIFQIKSEKNEDGDVLAMGFSYGKFSRRVGLRRELPAIGVTIHLGEDKKIKSPMPKIKFSLIQLGFEAKLKTLNIVEALRRARVPVSFSLMIDKLASQLSSAEDSNVPYVIIIGQKEALEDTVVIRDMDTRVQEI